MDDLSGLDDWAPKLWNKLNRRHRARLAARRVATLLAVVAVVGGCVTGFVLWQAEPARPKTPAPASATAAGGAAAADPFVGTAADTFASGAAGIVVPPARASGAFSPEQVAAALAGAKALLVRQNLDPRVFAGDLAALGEVLAPSQADDLARLAGDDSSAGLLLVATRFAPGVRGPTATPRVRGSMTVDGSLDVLDVRVNYVFVYPLAAAAARDGWRLVVVHREETLEFYRPGLVRDGDEGPYLRHPQVTSYSSDCAAERSGYLKPEVGGAPGPDAVDERDPSFEMRYDPRTRQAARTCSQGRVT